MKTTYCVVRMESYSDSTEETPTVEARFDSRRQAEQYVSDVMGADGDTPVYRVMTERQWEKQPEIPPNYDTPQTMTTGAWGKGEY